ncbi:MAG TPA: TetR/AcrR family transcriptional regulator [Acidimicrobiia bacterium]|nr:TetR/AcrR family transcriptional regulator [Acidimicrobiia bacterium]
MTTQQVRRAQTRTRLLEAAAQLFATRGIDGSSIDAIADLADRTSGAVYDHFGGKEGLLFALLESWVDDVAVVINAELAAATTLDERLATLWRNIVDPPSGGSDWIALEHELWRYATRNDTARAQLARRYQAMWDGVGAAAGEWVEGASRVGPALIGLLLGLEMMRRVDPDAVTDELAVAALRGVVEGAVLPKEKTR